jgi:hypothetical protein
LPDKPLGNQLGTRACCRHARSGAETSHDIGNAIVPELQAQVPGTVAAKPKILNHRSQRRVLSNGSEDTTVAEVNEGGPALRIGTTGNHHSFLLQAALISRGPAVIAFSALISSVPYFNVALARSGTTAAGSGTTRQIRLLSRSETSFLSLFSQHDMTIIPAGVVPVL